MANVGASVDLGGPAGGSAVPSNARTTGKDSGFSGTAAALRSATCGFPAQEIGALDEASDLYEVPGNLSVPNVFGRAAQV